MSREPEIGGGAATAATSATAGAAGGEGDAPEAQGSPRPGSPARAPAGRAWWLALLAIVVVALGVRVGYTLGWKQVDEIAGDAYYYHRGANLLADGHGFVHPYAYDNGVTIPGADHPPGTILVLAVPSLVGLDTILAHQLVGSVLGAGTVLLLGLAGRRIGGNLAGLAAAGLGALYPALWLNDAALMSESVALLCGTFVILAAYRAWDVPTGARFAVAGLAIGLATLARAEALMLVGLLAVPLAVWAPGLRGARARLGRLGLAAGTAVLVISPWVVANLVRFEEPATLSTQMGPTLEAANCDETYGGPGIGSWSLACVTDWGDRDRSELDRLSRETALDYAGDHRDRLPAVLVARFARTFHLAHVSNQVNVDEVGEGRPAEAARVGVGAFWLVAVAAVVGVAVLRRRGIPSFPLWTTVLNVVVTVLLFYGSTRFRAPAEPAFVLAAAVAVDAAVRRLRRQPVPAP